MNDLHLKTRRSGHARTLTIALLVSLVLLGGCRTRGGPVPYNVPGFGLPDRTAQRLPADVLVAPLDKVQVTVFRVPELSSTYEVSVGGKLNLPLIGSVEALNRSPQELSEILEQRYGSQYLRNPDITVSILESQQSRLVMDGAVNRAAVYAIKGGTDLLTAVAMAGGLKEEANSRRVAVFRKIDGVSMAAAFDLSRIRAGLDENPSIYPGDIVYVDSVNGVPPEVRDILQTLTALTVFSRITR